MVFDHDYKAFPELSNSQIADFGFTSPHVQYVEDFDAFVEKVTDGDTVRLITKDRDFSFPLRLLDIDAPELSEGGEDAGDWLRGQILGEDVRIIIDRKQRVGKYGRLLGKVMHRGLDMGETMLSMGLVSVFGSKDEFKVPNIFRSLREGAIP